MEIIKSNIEEMMKEMDYVYEDEFSEVLLDDQLKSLFNYFLFLEKYEEKIIETKKISLEIILYSKYYWFSRFLDRYHEVYGPNAGLEQQQFQMLEEIEHRAEQADWEFVEKLDNGSV